ncbi:MAG: polymer-forming cytoskeletal protein [Lysobacterales bacterium]
MFKNETGENGAQIETLVGEKTQIKGDLTFSGGLHIDGHVEGSVTAADGAGTVHISDSGRVTGEVRAPVIIVNGQVDGDVHALERLELRENARVSGNIHYTAIEMKLGAEVNGQLISKAGSQGSATAEIKKPATESAKSSPSAGPGAKAGSGAG